MHVITCMWLQYVITDKIVMLILQGDFLSLAGFEKASFHVIGCHMETVSWPGAEGYLQLAYPSPVEIQIKQQPKPTAWLQT